MSSHEHDLISQQHQLASRSYDVRISNLARFIHRLVRQKDSATDAQDGRVAGIQCDRDSDVQVVRNTGTLCDGDSGPQKADVRSCVPKLLDVGAGNGLILKYFKFCGFEVHGIELESELVKNMHADPELHDVDIIQGNITQMSGHGEYDLVIASDVIEHIKDDVAAIGNLWSFVKPGGQLVITVPAYQSLYGKRDVAWGHFRRYNTKLLEERIASAQLKNTHGIRITFWNIVGVVVYFIYEKVFRKPVNEYFRTDNSDISHFLNKILNGVFYLEEQMNGVPFGLTLILRIEKAI